MKIAAITDIGSCRQENQDNYCAQQLAGGTAWGIVCDGMGGVNGGRIAARIATDTMQQYFARHMKALQPGMEKTFIMRGFDITNRAVYEKSTSDPEMQGMGTATPAAAWPIWYTPGIPARICSMQVRCGRSPVTTRWYSSWWTAARSPVSRPPYTRKKT